jgi:hypothetical protein
MTIISFPRRNIFYILSTGGSSAFKTVSSEGKMRKLNPLFNGEVRK